MQTPEGMPGDNGRTAIVAVKQRDAGVGGLHLIERGCAGAKIGKALPL